MSDAEVPLGLVATAQRQFAEAERHFQRAAAMEPRNDQAHSYLGCAGSFRRNAGRRPGTKRRPSALSAGDLPTSVKLRIGLGSVCYLAGHYECAARTLLEPVRLRPDSAPAYFLLSEAYECAEGLQPAILAALAAYVKTRPRDAWANYHYGLILYAKAAAKTDHYSGFRSDSRAISSKISSMVFLPSNESTIFRWALMLKRGSRSRSRLTSA